MTAICGAKCSECRFLNNCQGCKATCGQPFGGTCVAAEYIQTAGMEKYLAFKQELLNEINSLLRANAIPKADRLYELPGSFINPAYPLPNGETVRFLDNKKVYLGTRITPDDGGISYGIAAGTDFILVCQYDARMENPELLFYKKRFGAK